MAKSKFEKCILPNLEKILGWVRNGATEKEVAGKLQISYSTLRKYLDDGEKGDERYSAFSAAYAHAREEPNDQVEASLYKSCVGYNAQIVKHYKVKTVEIDPKTGRRVKEKEELVEAVDEVHIPANPTAQMFWLTNQRPNVWKYKPDGKDSGEADESGVVMMPPVMENPGPPEAESGGADE